MKMQALRRALVLSAVVVAVWLLLGGPLAAHHGTAEYQMDQLATIKGAVLDYQLINPHTLIDMRVAGDGAPAVDWRVESVASNMMVRVGWSRESLKPGDTVTVTGHPGKNGKPVMLLVKLVMSDGRELDAPYQ